VLKLDENVIGWLERATIEVWLFLYFLVFPGVVPGLQEGSCSVRVKVLVGFKNLYVLLNSKV